MDGRTSLRRTAGTLTSPGRGTLVQAAVTALVAFVVVGPVFGPGLVLAYDLAWSPDPRFTPFALGTAGSAPRAVPSDAVAITLGHVLGAGLAQALVLWATLVLAGWGAARLAALLAPDLPVAGRVVATVAAVWNPFVLERLTIGHWTVLLGYAAVPHLVVSCVRVRRGARPPWSPAVGLAACGVGGANSLVICCLVVGVVLAVPGPGWRALAWSVASALGVSAVWALPALVAGVASAPEGATAFASRADTPLGVLGSLATGGGMWNTATHPAERSVTLVAVGALVVTALAIGAALRAARRRRLLVVVLPAGLGLVMAWLSAVDPFGAWSTVVVHVPGGGVLRDAQKLVAPWVALAAAGSGVLARDALRLRSAGSPLVALLGILPVALLPSLAWGVGSRVSAVEVPTDLREVSTRLSAAAGGGTVGLLPWSQYRRYEWNGNRVSLTLVPRMVDRRVVFDDSLPLSSGTVAGEDPAARRVAKRMAEGVSGLEALAAEGVRWVVIEKRTGLPGDPEGQGLPAGATVVHDGSSARVVELPPAPDRAGSGAGGAVRTGWMVTCLTWVLAAACRVRELRSRAGDRLVGSAP